MLVLVPADLADQDEQTKVGFRRAMEALLDVFNRSDHPGPLPICLAVTKSDMLSPQANNGSRALVGEPQDALPHWLNELVTLVRHQVGTDQTKVFLTSAFGGHADEDATRPPTTGPTPEGLEEPLRWVLAESDRCLFSPAAAKARRSLEHWPHGYKKAIKHCDRVIAKGLPHKEYQELEKLKAELGKARKRQVRRRSIASSVAVLVGMAVAFWLHADSLARLSSASIAAGSVTQASLESVRAFIESRNPACHVLFRSQQEHAQQWHEERALEQADRERDALMRNVDAPELHWQQRVSRAKFRASACEGFCQLFPTRPERFQFEEEQRRAETLVGELQVYGPFDDQYSDVLQRLEPVPAPQARELVDDFRARFPPDRYPLRGKAYERLASVVNSKAQDERHASFVTWEARIRADYAKDPSRRSGHLEEIAKWLAAYDTERSSKLDALAAGLRDLRRTIALEWDAEDYRKLLNAAGRMFEGPDKLRDAIQYGDEYLKAAREVLAMQGYVRDWLAYARALQTTRRVGLRPSYVKLWGTKFDESGKEQVKVVLRTRLDTQSEWGTWNSPGMKEFNGEAALAESPDYVSLAIHRGILRAEITEYDWPDGNEEGSAECHLLRLLEQYQKEGTDSAEAQVDVDGAKLTVIISDLPTRRSLPSYEKPR